MRMPIFVLAIAFASPAQAANLDGATMSWPWALPFVGLLVTIAAGPTAVRAAMARALWQDRRRVGGARLGPACVGLRRLDGRRGTRACTDRRVPQLHRVAVCALYGRRWHRWSRNTARNAACKHRTARIRDQHCKHRRHDRRGHDPDPPGDPRQCAAQAPRARNRVLHHSGCQCGRRTDAARRPAAVRRLPARRRFLLDCAASLAADHNCRRGGARHLLRCRLAA